MSKIKNIVIALIIITIITIISVVIVNKIIQSKKEYNVEQIDKYNYFVLRTGDKYGVIDASGNTVVEAKYESIKIPNPTKDRFMCYEGEKITILNSNNEKLFTEYETVEPINLTNIASDLAYEKSVLKYKQNDKYGIIDFEGKKLTEPIYEEINGVMYREGELEVKQDGKYGVINIKGTVLVKTQYDEIISDNYYSEENGYKRAGYIVGKRTEDGIRYGYINYKGKLRLKLEYNDISRVNGISDDKLVYLIASKNGQYGLIKDKKEIINFEYQNISYDETSEIFVLEKGKKVGAANINGNIIIPVENESLNVNGIYIYTKKDNEQSIYNNNGEKQNIDSNSTILNTENQKYKIIINNIDNINYYGVINNEGQQVISNQYSYIEYAYGGYFIACNQNGKLGVIDNNGKEVIELKYDLVQKIRDKNAIQTLDSSNNIIEIYSNNMQKKYSMKNANIEITNDYIKLYSENDLQYFDNDGNNISNIQLLKENKLFAKGNGNNWGFVEADGKEKVKFIYEKVTDFNKYGFAGIKLNGKWGVIDEEGKIVIEPTYELNTSYSEPDFVGEYYKVQYGLGEIYYTNNK